MATILLAAAGAAVGAGFGGTVLGLSGAVIGRAVGATLGRAIDQRILGAGSDAVEVGRLDRLSLMGAGEGTAIARCWGRMRLPGHVIWASDFVETQRKAGGGKGAPQPSTINYSYAVSLAIGLCEGEILGVGRIWADGREISANGLDMRVYPGSETQMADPAISAANPLGIVPAYRGLAYVVLENLSLEPFGNRVPQFAFEVLRKANAKTGEIGGYQDIIKAVSIIPGTGEFSYATEKVRLKKWIGQQETLNVHDVADDPDFKISLRQLKTELPSCSAASLVVSWFGNDLRCASCDIRPKIGMKIEDGQTLTQQWRAGGVSFENALRLPEIDGKSIYGGTPSDASVLQAIAALKVDGKDVMFYPFILMEQTEGNSLPNPYGYEDGQPAFPWRGRITLSRSAGLDGSPVGTVGARGEVAAFFGNALPSDFAVSGETVSYIGAEDWGYRRFILHYAHLCKIAGGVESFCVGSELRGMTGIMAENETFPAVEELMRLVEDVRAILGSQVKISYAADWSEYFGIRQGGDVRFHLDPLWSHDDVDFIGVDNYMPISDWRDGSEHADSIWKSEYSLPYLTYNIAGGEGFDWYYDSPEGEAYQRRKPILDQEHDEHWLYRYKDIQGWWSNFHHERRSGQRAVQPTAWIPGSKPIRFTEYGCPAVNRATNQPNVFFDPKSSASSLPKYSTGEPDDLIQLQYFRAFQKFWRDVQNNPPSNIYEGAMLDLEHCYAWAWDARPFPEFPRNIALWEDGSNWRLGHWLNGRSMAQPLELIVREICEKANVEQVETADLFGSVAGYAVQDVATGRSVLQQLSVVQGFDPVEQSGKIHFLTRGLPKEILIDAAETALNEDGLSSLEHIRLSDAELVSQVRLAYVSAEGEFSTKVAQAQFPVLRTNNNSVAEFTGLLGEGPAKAVAKRWLIEGEAMRDQIRLSLPPSCDEVRAGSVINLNGAAYRIDRLEIGEMRSAEGVRIEPSIYGLRCIPSEPVEWSGFTVPSLGSAFWLDIPTTDGEDWFPHVAVAANPWPGALAVWQGDGGADFEVAALIYGSATVGKTMTPLRRGQVGVTECGSALTVRLASGNLSSVTTASLLAGKNIAAIGDGSAGNWEIIQFRDATLVGADTYELRTLLRGQMGSDGLMPDVWPEGSIFVLLDNNVKKVPLAAQLRNVAQDYRVGNAAKGASDPDASEQRLSFSGVNLRPYSVCHISGETLGNGDCHIRWIRRARMNGDNWDAAEIPLAEERELYLLRILNEAGEVFREVNVEAKEYIYSASDRASDGNMAGFVVEISQISATFGAGLPRRSLIGF